MWKVTLRPAAPLPRSLADSADSFSGHYARLNRRGDRKIREYLLTRDWSRPLLATPFCLFTDKRRT
jgi:hypothetical protein